MKERPIIFHSQFIPQILDGTKTQTRRVIKIKKGDYFDVDRIECGELDNGIFGFCSESYDYKSPYGKVGDRLWVKETWAECNCEENNCPGVIYKNHLGAMNVKRWKPSIHMPKWASRITLEITDVRVERVQDISNQDVAFEGIPHIYYPQEISKSDPHYAFEKMFVDYWNSTAKEGFKWKDNPWVWVIEFERIET